MDTLNFKIGRLRHKFFTRAQKAKLEAGIDIFHQMQKSAQFKDLVLQFNWTNKSGKTFRRFLHSDGLSNAQVWEKFENSNSILEEMGLKACIAILPCESRKDVVNFKLHSSAIVWMSTSCLNNDWFTPIHVASSICHEIMINLGFKVRTSSENQDDYAKTVPYAFGQLLMESCEKWKQDITDIRLSFDVLDKQGYNYFPATEVFSLELANASQQTYENNISNLLGKLEREAETLELLEEGISNAEQNRLQSLQRIRQQLIEIHHEIQSSSLDGSELLNVDLISKASRSA